MKIIKFLPMVIACLSITACTPINVQEVGTPNVKVRNLADEPVPVALKEYRRRPIVWNFHVTIGRGENYAEKKAFEVPDSKVFVVQHIIVNFEHYCETGYIKFFKEEQNEVEKIKLLGKSTHQRSDGLKRLYISEPLTMYFLPNESIWVGAYRYPGSQQPPAYHYVHLIGYLLPSDSPSLAP
jgi:hypothetical protein